MIKSTVGHIIVVKRKRKGLQNGGEIMKDEHLKIILPSQLRGRNLETKVIPMLCQLKTTLNRLVEINGDASLLKQWEKRCYKSYCISEIQDIIIESYPEDWPEIVKEHILSKDAFDLGPSCLDIYLVAYVSETYGVGKEIFINYIKESGISTKENTANAIWKVGKADGAYLGVLNTDGTIRDINFFRQWTNADFIS